jgi:hypothetical protein
MQVYPLCSAGRRGMPKPAMMNQELIPKSTTTWETCELPSSLLPWSFKARAMSVHVSSTDLTLDGASSLVGMW